MYQAAKGWIKHIDFVIFDLLCLGLSYTTAHFIRNGFRHPVEDDIYINLLTIFLLTDAIVLGYLHTLKGVLKRDHYQEWIKTIKHVCMVTLSMTFILFVTQTGSIYSRIVVVLSGGFYLIISYFVRIIWKKYLLSKYDLSAGKRSLLLVTNQSELEEIVAEIKKNSYGRYYMAGIALTDSDQIGSSVDGVPIVANAETAADYVCRKWIDEVFINFPQDSPLGEQLLAQFIEMGVTVHQSIIKNGAAMGKKQLVEYIGPYTVLTTSINITTAEASLTKRLLDICGGVCGCLITGLLFLVFAPCIYIKSPGPIFFSQIRVGKNGKKFKIYKFRSMYLDAEERKKELMEKSRNMDGLMFKMDHDPRIIGSEKGNGKGIGNFIRKYSIDEFPQFWNVLKGDMSLVGTRPPTVDEWDKYSAHHRARLAIKPGITGAWQVSGRSNITDFEEVVRLDLDYIINWTFGQDIKILFKTVAVVFEKSGAM